MTEIRQMPLRRMLLLAAITGMVLSLALGITYPRRELIRVSAVYGSVDVPNLLASSEAVAVVRFTGESQVAWNSATKERWEPEVASGVSAWIYRDDTFDVVRTLRGTIDAARIVIRGVGGTVGNVTLEHDNQVDWETSGVYLLFLRREPTPTREGWEDAWTVTWHGHGSFVSSPSGWTNASRTLDIEEREILDAD